MSAWAMFVARHWKLAAVLCAMLLTLVVIHGWMERECSRRENAVRQAYQKVLEEERSRARRKEREMQMLVYEAEHANQSRLGELEAKYRDAVQRVGPVRVCRSPTDTASVPRDSPGPSISDGPTGGDGLSGGAGARDIGPGLVQLAKAADIQTARLIACQNYIRALEASR